MNQQTTWMYPNGIYVVSGGACANSHLFEDKFCYSIFFKYLHRFISPMATILHYKLNSSEWALLLQTKSKAEIKSAYLQQRNKSEKANRNIDITETHRMLSEHFRMFLSSFAKVCNMYRQRKGTIVMKRFDKFEITTEKSYKEEFDRICDLKFCSYRQILKKYRPDEKMYDEENLLMDTKGCPHLLRSAVGLYQGNIKLEKWPISIKIVWPYSDVLRKILKKSQNNKNDQNPNPKLE